MNRKKTYLAGLFLAATIERIFFDLGPNIELITMVMILASFYSGKKESFWLVFLIIATTDRILGNSSIFLFTWTGFLLPALISSSIIKKLITDHRSPITKKIFTTFSLTTIGLSANIFFFLWTNFGVWLLDFWKMYPDTLSGLIMSYINGLPFLKYQLTSTVVFIPLGYFLTELAMHINSKFQLSRKLEQLPAI